MGTQSDSIHEVPVVPPPRGKRPKRFLEKNDALSLAASIAEMEEKKTLTKKEKHHKSFQLDQVPPDHKNASKSKAKLKDAKCILLAKKAQAKKERSKLRKERFKAARSEGTGVDSSTISADRPKQEKPRVKRVSFA